MLLAGLRTIYMHKNYSLQSSKYLFGITNLKLGQFTELKLRWQVSLIVLKCICLILNCFILVSVGTSYLNQTNNTTPSRANNKTMGFPEIISW